MPRRSDAVLDRRLPAANGNIGTEQVAKSAADGYTLLLATDIQFAISPNTTPKLPYDPEKDFDPLSLVAFLELILAAHPSLAANNVHELVALAKTQPGKINYASTGPGSTHHPSIELLKSLGGFDLTHVPYKGSSQALPDLIAGQVQLMQLGVPQTLPHLKPGRLKALGVASTTRLAVLRPEHHHHVDACIRERDRFGAEIGKADVRRRRAPEVFRMLDLVHLGSDDLRV